MAGGLPEQPDYRPAVHCSSLTPLVRFRDLHMLLSDPCGMVISMYSSGAG